MVSDYPGPAAATETPVRIARPLTPVARSHLGPEYWGHPIHREGQMPDPSPRLEVVLDAAHAGADPEPTAPGIQIPLSLADAIRMVAYLPPTLVMLDTVDEVTGLAIQFYDAQLHTGWVVRSWEQWQQMHQQRGEMAAAQIDLAAASAHVAILN